MKYTYLWVSSHVGIRGIELADNLANQATERPKVDCELGLSLSQIKSIIRASHVEDASIARARLYDSSPSIQYYDEVALKTSYRYGKRDSSRAYDLMVARIRLGYAYPWHFMNADHLPDALTACRLCRTPHGHSLCHYLMDCTSVQTFRTLSSSSLQQQAISFLTSGKLPLLFRSYPRFAPPR